MRVRVSPLAFYIFDSINLISLSFFEKFFIQGYKMSVPFQISFLSPTRVQCAVVYSREQAVADYKKKLQAMKNRLNVPGFRPGKAPLQMIEKAHSAALIQDLIDNKISTAWPELTEKFRILERPLLTLEPSFKSIHDLSDDFSILLTFDIAPEFDLIAPADIEKTLGLQFSTDVSPSEEEKISYRKVLNYQASQSKSVDRSASIGDKIMLDVLYNATGKEEKNLELILDPSQTQQDFIDHVLGMNLGESKTFDYQRQAYQNETNAEKENVTVTLTAIFELIAPSLQELSKIILDLDKNHGEVSEESINQWISNTIQMMNEQKNFKINEKQLIAALVAHYSFEIPSVHTRDMSFENEEQKQKALDEIKLNYILGAYAQKYKIQAQQEHVDFFAKIFAQDLGIPLQYLASLLQSNADIKKRFEDMLVEKSVMAYLMNPSRFFKMKETAHQHSSECAHIGCDH